MAAHIMEAIAGPMQDLAAALRDMSASQTRQGREVLMALWSGRDNL